MSDRTLMDALRKLRQDVNLLQRRKTGGSVPARLSPAGQRVFNWDTDANEVGFYYSDTAAINGPLPATDFQGVVTRYGDSRVIQEVTQVFNDDRIYSTWRRGTNSGMGAWGPWELVIGHKSVLQLPHPGGWVIPTVNEIKRNGNTAQFSFNARRSTNGSAGTTIGFIPAGSRPSPSSNIWGHAWGLEGAPSATQIYYDAGDYRVKTLNAIPQGHSLAVSMTWPIFE